jgi:hypothetical protein
VIVLENNHKEAEQTVHYCQWDGNEAELEALFAAIDVGSDCPEFGGGGTHVSTFLYSRALIPEAAVQYHMRLPFGTYTPMFKKHKGVFTCPPFVRPKRFFEEGEEEDAGATEPITDPLELAMKLDEYFYAGGMARHFKREGPPGTDRVPAVCGACGV